MKEVDDLIKAIAVDACNLSKEETIPIFQRLPLMTDALNAISWMSNPNKKKKDTWEIPEVAPFT